MDVRYFLIVDFSPLGTDAAGRAPTLRHMASPLEGRITARDRDGALEELSHHFSEGRLDVSEFDERCAAASAAVTRSQLAALFADLPGVGGGAPMRPGRSILPTLILAAAAVTLLLALLTGDGFWLTGPVFVFAMLVWIRR